MRIVIGEDQPPLREALARLLSQAGHEVLACAADGPSLAREALVHRADLVITEVRLPSAHGDDGMRTARAIRYAAPDTAILLLSHEVEVRYAVELLDDGWHSAGYLLKQRLADVECFFDAVRRIANGACVIDPEIDAALRALSAPGRPRA